MVDGTVTTNEAPVTAPVEGAAPEVVKTPEVESSSSRLNAIAKRDKAALMRMRAAQAKEVELVQREKRAQELEAKYSKKPANPIEALMAAGFSYKDATDFVLNGERISPELEVKKVRADLDEYKKSVQDQQREADERALQTAREQESQAVENFKEQINEFVDTNAGDYELITLHDAQDLVFQTINEHFERTKAQGKPKIMSTKEAADLVEQHLFEKIEESVNKAKRFKSKFAAVPEEKKEGIPKQSQTLSNSMTSSAASTLPARTEQDRIKRALAALEKTS